MTGNERKDLWVLFLRGKGREKRRQVRKMMRGQELGEIMAWPPKGGSWREIKNDLF